MSYSRLWGGGAWYIYLDIGGYLSIHFDNTSGQYTDGTHLRIRENQHIAPLLEGLTDMLAENIQGNAAGERDHWPTRPGEPPSSEQWFQIESAYATLGDLLKRRQEIGDGQNTVKYGGKYDAGGSD